MISASKSTLSLNNLKILRPKVRTFAVLFILVHCEDLPHDPKQWTSFCNELHEVCVQVRVSLWMCVYACVHDGDYDRYKVLSGEVNSM